jgi:phosphate/sulfate permease
MNMIYKIIVTWVVTLPFAGGLAALLLVALKPLVKH